MYRYRHVSQEEETTKSSKKLQNEEKILFDTTVITNSHSVRAARAYNYSQSMEESIRSMNRIPDTSIISQWVSLTHLNNATRSGSFSSLFFGMFCFDFFMHYKSYECIVLFRILKRNWIDVGLHLQNINKLCIFSCFFGLFLSRFYFIVRIV